MSNQEDWRAKFERSEAARQKLREALVLVKEKALNTEQVLKQNNELKAEIKTVKKEKRKVEKNASELTKTLEQTQTDIARLKEHVAQLQSQMAVVVQQSPHLNGASGSAGGSAILDIVTRTEMNALQKQLEGLAKQQAMWNKAMKEVQQQPGGGGGPSSKKRPAPASVPAGEEDPVRARAVAILQANKAQNGNAPTATAAAKEKQQQLPPKKKKVRLSEDGLQQQRQAVVVGGGSAGRSEAAPPGFADVAIAALRAVMGSDAEQAPSTAAVQDAVRILGNTTASGNINTTSQIRNIVAAFSCAVLECAAAAPARRFAGASLSPQQWFKSTAAAAAGKKGRKSAAAKTKDGIGEKDKGRNPSFPSFLGVWCSSEVLLRHSLPWLLHCAIEISSSFTTAAAAAVEDKKEENLCQLLAQDLAVLVIKEVATGSQARPALHSPTELCAAAAAAAALWRAQGDFRSFQVFILDLLLSKLDTSEVVDVLAPVAAAIESWPEALFGNTGNLGGAVHVLLQIASRAGKRSRLLEIRLAATWLQKVGVEKWKWKEEWSEEKAEALEGAARKELAKFLPADVL